MERESKYLEYKESIESDTFLKTVSAFSNYSGGTIIFGIDNELKIIGIKDTIKALLDIENKINGNIKPNPSYELEVNKKYKTIELRIQEGQDKPYLYKGKAYKRNDSSTIEVDRNEFIRLSL